MLVAVLGAISLAPRPCLAQTDADLWPMAKGTKWTLETTMVDAATHMQRKATQLVTVTQSRSGKAGTIAAISYSIGGQVTQVERYMITPLGVYRTAGGADGNATISPIMPLVKYPATPGSKWQWAGTITQGTKKVPVSSTINVLGVETLKTPAGTYKTLHIHTTSTSNEDGKPQTFANDLWFAKGVGMVQQRATIGTLTVTAVVSKVALAKE
jgi:hypothetical protein